MATYYWVGGSGTWDSTTTTNWAASSGGAGNAGVPTSSDNVVFDANSNTGTSSFTVTAVDPQCQDLTIGSLDGAMTLSAGDFFITGNVTLPATNFSFSGASSITYVLTKNASITTNGVSIPSGYFLLADDNSGYTLTLNDNLTFSSNFPSGGFTAIFNLLNGVNLNLNGKTLTTHSVDLTQIQPTNSYRLIFGTTGKIIVTGADTTVWKDFDGVNSNTGTYAYASGSCNVEFTSTAGVSTTAISMSQAMAGLMPSGSSIYNVKVNAGTNTVTLNAVSSSYACVKNLDFTGFSGTFSSTSNRRIEGNLTFSSTMTVSTLSNTTLFAGVSNVTTNGKTITSACTLSGSTSSIQLQGAFTMTNTLTFTMNSGTLDLNNFTFTTGLFTQANDTATRVIAFGTTGKIVLSRVGIGTATLWNCPTITNFSYTGTSRVETSGVGTGTRNYYHGNGAGGAESKAISLYIKTTQPTVQIIGHFKNLDFTGSSSRISFVSLDPLYIYGDLTLSATMTSLMTSGVGAQGGFHLKGGTGVTQYITTNGFNGDAAYYACEGAATYVLNDNLTATTVGEVTCGIYVYRGTFDSNDKTIDVAGFLFSPVFGAALMYLKSSSVTTRGFYFYTPVTYSGTLYPGTSTITATNLLDTSLYFGTYNFNNVVVSTSGNTTYRYGGTIENFTHTVTSTRTMSFEAGKTFTFGTFNCTGTSSFRLTIQSATSGSTYTISKSNSTAVSLSYCTIKDFFAGTASVWKALTSNGNVNNGNNYGIQFTPPQGKGLEFFS